MIHVLVEAGSNKRNVVDYRKKKRMEYELVKEPLDLHVSMLNGTMKILSRFSKRQLKSDDFVLRSAVNAAICAAIAREVNPEADTYHMSKSDVTLSGSLLSGLRISGDILFGSCSIVFDNTRIPFDFYDSSIRYQTLVIPDWAKARI
jgi:hypothetical protein